MKALIRVTKDTYTLMGIRDETLLEVHGKGKAAVVEFVYKDGRRVEYRLYELQSALKGLELSVR